MESIKAPRKACDLCYNKRIKCDAQKPRCSHCVVYSSDCTYEAASRKVAPRKKRRLSTDEESLQFRVKTLEDQLKTVLGKLERLESSGIPVRIDPEYAPGPDTGDVGRVSVPDGPSTMSLPPIQEMLPIVHRYLATVNAVYPLFQPATLLQIVDRWVSYPHSRDAVSWAAINVVLALAQQDGHANGSNPTGGVVEYINNAQSVMTKVIMGETDLLNVQVLVGLVMLLQGAEDLGPATILIATTLRLIHKLGLHTKKSSVHLETSMARQRDRVFWLAYIFDRELNMRTQQPFIQNDRDIDVDIPLDDGTGYVYTTDGRSRMNFFRARVQLARIQGRMYDDLFSVHAQRLSHSERSIITENLLQMLGDWHSQIPPGFHATAISQSGSTSLIRMFGIIYGAHLMCRSIVSRAHSMDWGWATRLRDYGEKAAVGDLTCAMPLPQDWQSLLVESRSYMTLHLSMPSKDSAFIWITACAQVTSFLCLTANIMLFPNHEEAVLDRELTEAAFRYLDDMAKQTGSQRFIEIRDACNRLAVYATAITRQKMTGEAPNPIEFSSNWSLPTDLFGSSYWHFLGQGGLVTAGIDNFWELTDGTTL